MHMCHDEVTVSVAGCFREIRKLFRHHFTFLHNVFTEQCCVNRVLKPWFISYKLTGVLSVHNLPGNWNDCVFQNF